ncbi:DoxX family membrane protein [Roseivirga sp.]|uniref:DoxX family membrane protein n=1 Tax=Roseivirga sp. TaxID=1964215 RepID=UPI003B525CFB
MLNKVVALFFIRTLLGIIFLMQGYGKVFNWGISNIYDNMFKGYEEQLPKFMVQLTAYFTSYTELIGGLLLILGLFRNYTLYALAAVLLIVSFGHGLATPIWNLSDVLFRSILLTGILLLPQEWDMWSLDRLRDKKNK